MIILWCVLFSQNKDLNEGYMGVKEGMGASSVHCSVFKLRKHDTSTSLHRYFLYNHLQEERRKKEWNKQNLIHGTMTSHPLWTLAPLALNCWCAPTPENPGHALISCVSQVLIHTHHPHAAATFLTPLPALQTRDAPPPSPPPPRHCQHLPHFMGRPKYGTFQHPQASDTLLILSPPPPHNTNLLLTSTYTKSRQITPQDKIWSRIIWMCCVCLIVTSGCIFFLVLPPQLYKGYRQWKH